MKRRPKTIAFWTGRLPHWEVEGGRYFITLHLAGAIPASAGERLRAMADELRRTSKEYEPVWLRLHRLIFRTMEKWLDQAERSALLGRREIAEVVVEAIEHRHHRGDWEVFEYVVMPSHIHLFCQIAGSGLKVEMEDFKRWTGRRVAELADIQHDRLWQREWFDHWSRSDEQDDDIVRYIRNNPVKAGLVKHYTDWPYGGWSRR